MLSFFGQASHGGPPALPLSRSPLSFFGRGFVSVFSSSLERTTDGCDVGRKVFKPWQRSSISSLLSSPLKPNTLSLRLFQANPPPQLKCSSSVSSPPSWLSVSNTIITSVQQLVAYVSRYFSCRIHPCQPHSRRFGRYWFQHPRS